MQAETRTLTQLFQLDVRYVIPLYQRPYVWSEERQWAPLWDDIATIAGHIVAEGATAHSPTHFLGAIVIQQLDNAPGTPQLFLVIDGQQRLATLQMVIVATARAADAMGCPKEAELLRRLVYNNELLAQDDERFKVWPTNANQAAFRIVMQPDGDPAKASDDPGNEVQEAYAFFRREIDAWVAEDGAGGEASDVAPHFAALRVSLSDLLKLVSIRLEEGDNPQVIFETLNARGTPLIALDLLKNSVFLAADNEGANTDKLYTQHWAPELDLDYWRTDRRQGRLFTKNGDLFLQYWLVAELAEPVPASELFQTFRERVLQPADRPPMTELIPALARDAAVLRGFEKAPADSPEGRFYGLLDMLDTTTLMPLALTLHRPPEITAEQRAKAFAVLESFLVRRLICGWTTKNYNRLAASLVPAIKDDPAHAYEILRQRLAAETAPANRWPADEDVREAVLSQNLYGARRRDRLVMILWQIEERLRQRDKKAEQGLAPPKHLTLEHLIPQSWEQHWPLDESQADPLAWRLEHLHRLGNLTLTTGRLNSSLSNGPWYAPQQPQDKSRALVEHSLLKLNSSLVRDRPERFDEHDIDRRGAELATEIISIWPGPGETIEPHAEPLTSMNENHTAGEARADGQWDESSFFEALEAGQGPAETAVAHALMEWAEVQMPRFTWGKGSVDGSFIPVIDHNGQAHYPLAVYTDGRLEIQFQWLTRPPFDDVDLRREFLGRLNEIPGVSIPEDAITRRPRIQLSLLAANPAAIEALEAALDWFCETVRTGS